MSEINLAILASGSGTNAENIAHYFKGHKNIRISLIGSNKPDAYVLTRAQNLNIPFFIFSKNELQGGHVEKKFKGSRIHYVILAGFLLKIPQPMILSFPDRIINIHPALLPKYGGQGMYGDNVHKAIIANNETISGITIHLVNENYDEGEILNQVNCTVDPSDTFSSLAGKIHKLEYDHYPKTIEDYILTHRSGLGK